MSTLHFKEDLDKLKKLASIIVRSGKIPEDLTEKAKKITGKPIYETEVIFNCPGLSPKSCSIEAEHDFLTSYPDTIRFFVGREQSS